MEQVHQILRVLKGLAYANREVQRLISFRRCGVTLCEFKVHSETYEPYWCQVVFKKEGLFLYEGRKHFHDGGHEKESFQTISFETAAWLLSECGITLSRLEDQLRERFDSPRLTRFRNF